MKFGNFKLVYNCSSDEKVHETKIVDLEKLNKNDIQKFFI